MGGGWNVCLGGVGLLMVSVGSVDQRACSRATLLYNAPITPEADVSFTYLEDRTW